MLFSSVLFVAVAAAAPLVERATCPSVQLFVARGTFEAQGYGLQQSVVTAILNKVPGSNASAVVYPASPVDISGSIQSGVANTQAQISEYYGRCPQGKIVLLGYSQGAQAMLVVHRLNFGNGRLRPPKAISGGGTGEPGGALSPPATPIPQSIGQNVVAVILFGDPNRVLGQGTDNEAGSCTVSSSAPRPATNQAAMSFYANRLDEYCASGDPVCCASGNNIFAHLGYFGTDNQNAIANYVAARV